MVHLKASIFVVFLFFILNVDADNIDYRDALNKAILFFQGQRSGRLPNPYFSWRGDSGLSDGHSENADLIGGYYDAGDNVKFNFPMAFTTTMLSWGAIEYAKRLGPQLQITRDAIRWATDYLLKCARETPGRLYAGNGNPNSDHACWERPEDMDTDRTSYYVSAANPGSDLAGETAAALAAASIVFRKVDPTYSKLLLGTAVNVMEFANTHRGKYSDSVGTACPFYCSYSGFTDELLWGAGWLYRATRNETYLQLFESLNNDSSDIFSWDNKFAAANVLLARRFLVNKDANFEKMNGRAQEFVCKILPDSASTSTRYTNGGLMYKIEGTNLQYVTAITFLLTTYAKYMSATKPRTAFNCGGSLRVTPTHLRDLAQKQIDYILGKNPLGMSYMVGFGSKFPKHIHHRGSSIPSIKALPQKIGCQEGFTYYRSPDENPNELIGAIVGGPDFNDHFNDDRSNYGQSEPATYVNAAAVGTLAYFAGRSKPL